MKRVQCHVAVVLAIALCAAKASATAISLGTFAISPPSPTANDVVSLGGSLLYPTTGFQVSLIAPTVGPPPNLLVVDVFVSSPAAGEPVLEVLTSDTISVPFGKLQPGHYDWLLNVFDQPRGSDVGNGSVVQTGSFTVPEPGALALLALAVAALILLPGARAG
jgi:hypothetical protein